jgi:Fe-S cluster biogenesis protein NfuA
VNARYAPLKAGPRHSKFKPEYMAEIKITATPLSDPDICNFTIEGIQVSDRQVYCRDRKMAEGSALFEALFEIDIVREVLVSGKVITVAKSTHDSWQVIGKQVGAALRGALQSGRELIPPEWNNKPLDNGFIFKEVEQILKSRINPGVAAHGGRIELVDVKGTSVYLRLSGGCQGCGAANVTLKQGIEKAIRARLPQVTEVIDITDHASGKNPFYKTKRNSGSPLE